MASELRVGQQVLYQAIQGSVLEMPGHDTVLIDFGELGVATVGRNEVIAIAPAKDILAGSTLSRISNEDWQKAAGRADAIRTLIASGAPTRGDVKTAASKLGLSERHLWRLIRDFRQHETISGLVSLAAGRKTGAKVLPAEVERVITEMIETHFLQPERWTRTALHERIVMECERRVIKPPSFKTVSSRLDDYRSRESQRKRIGAKAARYQYQPMPGHVEVSGPLERVEIDHTPLDVMVRSDDRCCDYVGRPWLSIAIDVYTRCILGIQIGFEVPSILSVALCLTHAVLPKSPAAEFGVPLDWGMHGIPKEIVVDNGKDFVSTAFRRGCEQYGILLTYRPVGSPHYGGTIERLIGTMVGQCHLLPGTTKNSVKARRDYDSVKHAALTLSQARSWFVEQLLGRYHLLPHRTLRIPPEAAWKRAMEGEGGV
ncbi:integrase catalytic domain-containing protein [Lysobacter enzymogenes]|uniref:integrase catalytic domain-containing protein n=1 Tax=Lysobacter enzymogenes TaxID=69 RepID=UPI00089D3B13|nr:DDE-type integrase/transposase/recombinase [Lysobacter enzymogenes]SDX70770.1 putative transposase [Lysobacter enzymogenes]